MSPQIESKNGVEESVVVRGANFLGSLPVLRRNLAPSRHNHSFVHAINR